MIDQKQIHKLSKKVKNKFIKGEDVAGILKLKNEEAMEAINFLEKAGYIEKSGIEGYWQLAMSGQVLSEQVLKKEYKVETLRDHLDNLIKRAKFINKSKKYPYYVECMKIISEFPIEHRSYGIEVVFSLKRKNITDKQYERAANKLRKEHKGIFGNTVAYAYYPQTVVGVFLKSRVHVLKLTWLEEREIDKIAGSALIEY
jgi:hypothetical protein